MAKLDGWLVRWWDNQPAGQLGSQPASQMGNRLADHRLASWLVPYTACQLAVSLVNWLSIWSASQLFCWLDIWQGSWHAHFMYDICINDISSIG